MEFDRQARSAESRALEAALIGFQSRRQWLQASQGQALAARVAHHLSFVRRYEPPHPRLAQHDWLHVVHWNVLFGTHYDRVLTALRSAPELAGADVISLNETDLGMPRTGNRDVAFDLARELGLHAAWTALFLEMDGGPRQPPARGVGPAGESLFGLALLSRFPLGELRRVELTSPADLLFDRERRAGGFVAIVAEVLRPGAPFHMVVTHLDVHGSPLDRARQMREVLAAVPDGPAILAGDLNTTTAARGGWSQAARTFTMMAWWPRPVLRRRYLAPYEPATAPREPLFTELLRAGFAFEPFNNDIETLDLRFKDLHELDDLPAPLRRAALGTLRPVERRNSFRLDWIAARGFRPAPERPPFALPQLMRGPDAASDHAPVGCGLRAE